MFTIADIYNIAIQIERNGEREYKKAAEKTDDPELSRLYSWMSTEEKAHAEWFARMLREKPVESSSRRELDEMGREMLQKIISDSSFPVDEKELQEITDPLEAVDFARFQEQETIDLYEFLSSLIEDEEVRADLRLIIEEEQEHIRTLSRMRAGIEKRG